MNFVNICLLCFYIYIAIKYYKKLKDTDERLKDNEIDYSEIKLKLDKLFIEYDNLKLRYIDLENKINDDDKISINDF